MTVDFMVIPLKAGYHEENWNLRTSEHVRVGNELDIVVWQNVQSLWTTSTSDTANAEVRIRKGGEFFPLNNDCIFTIIMTPTTFALCKAPLSYLLKYARRFSMTYAVLAYHWTTVEDMQALAGEPVREDDNVWIISSYLVRTFGAISRMLARGMTRGMTFDVEICYMTWVFI